MPDRMHTSLHAARRRASVCSRSVVPAHGRSALSLPIRWLRPPATAKPVTSTSPIGLNDGA